MVRGTSFIIQHGKSRATIEHQMKKTLQAYTVILAFSATGSMTSVAVEETDEKKPPRVERSERGERDQGERRGQRRGGPRQVPKEMLEKFDKDGDGKLDEEERKEAMKARRGGGPQGRRPEGGRPGGGRPEGGRPGGGRPEGGRPGGRRPGGEKPGDKKPDA